MIEKKKKMEGTCPAYARLQTNKSKQRRGSQKQKDWEDEHQKDGKISGRHCLQRRRRNKEDNSIFNQRQSVSAV